MTPVAVIRRAYDIYEEAAGLCRLLAAVESAHLLEEDEKLDILLSQITALDCSRVAEDLDVLAQMDRSRQSAERRALVHDVRSSSPPLPPVAEVTEAATEIPSQPLTSVIPLDPYSRKA